MSDILPGNPEWKPGMAFTPPHPVPSCACKVCALPYIQPDPVFTPYAIVKISPLGEYQELTDEEYAALAGAPDSVADWAKDPTQQSWFDPLVKLLDNVCSVPNVAGVFDIPVDPELHGAPGYFNIVTHPMDLGTLRTNLMSGVYTQPEQVVDDLRRVFHNAFLYNPPGTWVFDVARKVSLHLERLFAEDINSLGMRQ